jgi:hypothetical protein
VTGRLRSPRFLATAGLILLWWGASAALALWFSGRIRDWAVMTDELQYAKLALSVAEARSPLPSIHGTTVSVANQLYPVVIAPLYGSLSSPDAFRAAHVSNAFVMTSAAFPAYLLGRQVLDRGPSFAVALLTVVTPWMVLTGVLMSEVVAYPAFLWAILCFHRAIVHPSTRRDLLAAAALAVAVLARTQFAVLALVLPLAILAHELVAARAPTERGVRTPVRAGARAAVRRHRALTSVYAAGAIVAVAASLAGYRVFGAYTTTVEGGALLPAAVWTSAVRHLDVVGIGCGLVPLLLGGGWILAAAIRPLPAGRHALAMLSGITIVALAVETASFDLRFGGEEIIRDRYLFYVVPLLLVASAAALTEERRRPVVIGAAAVTAAVAATVPRLPFPTFPGLSVDSPVSILNETLAEQSGALGTGTFVAIATLLLGVVLVLSVAIAPRLPLAIALFAAVLGFSALTLRSEVDRVLDGTSLAGRPLAGPPGLVLDWVDSVVPPGETASVVPFPLSTAWGVSAIQWWDVEFWNRTITRSFVASDGNFTYTNFPQRTLEIDPVSGVVPGTSNAPRYVVTTEGDPRFRLSGRRHASNLGLVVLDAERPYRAVWSSRGLHTDGWTRPGVPASIRVHPRPGAGPVVERVHLRLYAPERAAARYRVVADTTDRAGEIAARAAADEIVLVCVTPDRPVDVSITASTSARVPSAPLSPEVGATRLVGVGLGSVAVQPTGRTCEA